MVLKIIGVLGALMVAAYCQNHHGQTFSLQTLVTHEVPQKVEHYYHQDSEQKNIPTQKHVVFAAPEIHSHVVSSQTVNHHASDDSENIIPQTPLEKRLFTPKEPAPVYESVEPVRAPVELKIVKQTAPYASTQHRVLQFVQQIPIKPQIIRVASIAPITHQAAITPIFHQPAITPIVHQSAVTPIIHQAAIAPIPVSPIQHHAIQASTAQHHSVQVSHFTPIENKIVQVTTQNPIQHSFVQLAHSSDSEHYKEESHTETSHKESHHAEHDDGHYGKHIDYFAYPKYEFAYEVKDPHTHDEKFQHESRDGDVVKGVYSLHEPDGSVRTVKYSSDKKTGFNAEVSHKGHTEHIVPHHHH